MPGSTMHPKYKDSEIEWLGAIPRSWEIIKLKYLSEIETGSNDTQDRDLRGRYPFFVRSNNIEYTKDYKYDREAVLTAGDGDVGKVFHYYNGKFSAHQRVYIFSSFRRVTGKFLYYYLKANLAYEVLKSNAKTTVDSLRRAMLTEFPIALPKKSHQKQIAEFIDIKCSQIDSLISDKERLIELLEEKRKVIITETVTKGINPNVEMKYSGIEWIGDIPNYWDVSKVRYLGQLQNGISKSGNDFGYGYPFVSYSDVFNNMVLPNSVKGLVNSTKFEKQLYSVKEGDVFFTRTSETAEEIAYASTCLKDIVNATFAGFLIRFRPDKNLVIKNYLKYYFRSHLRERYFIKEMNVVTRASLSQGLLKNTPVIMPPIEEQKLIGEYLDNEVNNINNLMNLLKSQISKLKEYRESLIYEAVTGKIDIRDYAAETEEAH